MRKLNALAAAVLVLGCAQAARAQDAAGIKARVQGILEKEYASLEELYKGIHTHPELSLKEQETAKRMAREYRAAGFEVTEGVGGNGVVAVMKNGEGKTLLLRTELDALPVKEATGAAYASTVVTKDAAGNEVPVMHACGHDMHMACMVGAARVMAGMKDKWKGTLVIIGQPAEEVVQGANAILKDGLFTKFPKPDFCISQHVDATLEAGKYGVTPGFGWANSDSIDIVIRGGGGHGSAPHLAKDPIVLAAEVVLALQTIVSREVKPGEAAVVTVGSIHGGTKHNIIPDEVKLELTVRTYKDEVRTQILKAIERIVKGLAQAAGIPDDRAPTVTLRWGTPATYNTPELCERVGGVLKSVAGEGNVVPIEPSMGAEDFGMYGRTQDKIPICMIRLGSVSAERIAAKNAGKLTLPGLHSSLYLPERETTLRSGVMSMSVIALELLGK